MLRSVKVLFTSLFERLHYHFHFFFLVGLPIRSYALGSLDIGSMRSLAFVTLICAFTFIMLSEDIKNKQIQHQLMDN